MKTQMEIVGSEERVFPLQWYAAAWSRDVREKPVRRKILGREIVLFRDEAGRVQVIQAHCTHRGADLSLGSCRGGRLMCAYHGWEFAGDGRCLAIPSQPDRPIPEFAHTRAYPVREEAGLIWVYPASVEPGDVLPELDLFPELADRSFTLTPFGEVWKAHLTRTVESVLDVAHLAFVHKKTIGRGSSAKIDDMDFEAERDRIVIQLGDGELEYRFPQQWILRSGNNRFLQYLTFTPIDGERTALFGLAGRTFARWVPGMGALFAGFSSKVLREDQAIVESQHPRPIPEALRMEAHVEADGPQVRFRQRWYEFLTADEGKVEVGG